MFCNILRNKKKKSCAPPCPKLQSRKPVTHFLKNIFFWKKLVSNTNKILAHCKKEIRNAYNHNPTTFLLLLNINKVTILTILK